MTVSTEDDVEVQVGESAFTVRMPSELKEWLREHAFDRRVSQNYVVVEALMASRRRAEERV